MSDIQRTDEWFKARLGCVTASRVADVMAKTRNGDYSASRKNYMAELVCERLTGQPTIGFESTAMKWGTDTEPMARASYEIETGMLVTEVGFILHPTIEMFGSSPDGLIDPAGGVEIKCPNTATHIETLLGANVKMEYVYQMQTGMDCTEKEWWDFVSFDPRLNGRLQLFIKRFYRDDKMISNIEKEVSLFLEELDETVAKLEALK